MNFSFIISRISVYDGDSTSDSSDWQTLSYTETAPAGAESLRIIIRVYGDIGGTVAVDNVVITDN